MLLKNTEGRPCPPLWSISYYTSIVLYSTTRFGDLVYHTISAKRPTTETDRTSHASRAALP